MRSARPKPAGLEGRVAALLVLLVFVLGCEGQGAAKPAPPAASPQADDPAPLRPEFDPTDRPVVDHLKDLESRFGVSISLGADAAGRPLSEAWPPLTIYFDATQYESLSDALDELGKAADLRVTESGSGWLLDRPQRR